MSPKFEYITFTPLVFPMYDKTMEQKQSITATSGLGSSLPLLIVDKQGTVGTVLAKRLRDQFLVVIVTAHEVDKHKNSIHIPYHKKIPTIPDHAYSHIFVIYNGEKELLEMLSAFEEKAEAIKARFLFITSLLYSTQSLFTRLQKPEYALMQIILFGETFEDSIREANETNFFIHQARAYGRIEVPKEGLGALYPILFDDVITSLITLAFAVQRPKGPLFLFPHHVYNQITVARIIQKIDPLIKVDFSKKKSTSPQYYIPTTGLYYFKNYDLEEKLHKIDLSRIGRRTQLPQKKIRFKTPHPGKDYNYVGLGVFVLLTIALVPILIALFVGLIGAGAIALSVNQAEQGNLQAAESIASFAQGSFTTAQAMAPSLLLPQAVFPHQEQQFLDMIQAGKTISQTELSLFQSVQLLKDIYNGKSADPKNDFFHAQTNLKNSLLTLQQLEAEHTLPQPILQKIHTVNDLVSLIEETIDTWPSVFGFEGKKTYLLLFQNNMELRPGGGFIGSYGTISFEKGRSTDFQIHDVYDADGHLSERVQPPYGLQRYLGISHWFLRDSNFDVDFPNDAKEASLFLKKETGQRVDGVVAINTTFLKNLISVVGSVPIPDYHVTVTPDNFYLLTETNAEKNFFPGSTQKKDFLRSLTNALFDNLSLQKTLPYENFAHLFISSIQQKDLLFAFSNSAIQNIFTVNGLSSSLWDGRDGNPTTDLDFVGVVDANVGTNKANYYVKRSITQSTSIDAAGGHQTTLDATYTNTSTSASAFGGDYKDYAQFVIPANANLTSVSFDNKQVQTVPAVTDPAIFTASGFIPPAALEVNQTIEHQKKIVGFFFIIPQGTTRTVRISYSVPSEIDKNAVSFTYNLRLFKQPGSGNDPYQLSLSYPNDVTVVANDKALTNVGGKLIYDSPLTEDRTISATFSKK